MIEPPPAFFIPGSDELRAEEDVPQVHGEPLFPVRRRDVLELVPIVIRCVVHQHRDRAGLGLMLAIAARNASMSVTSH